MPTIKISDEISDQHQNLGFQKPNDQLIYHALSQERFLELNTTPFFNQPIYQ